METSKKKAGFGPIFDEKSRLLILGSFPSVKSREIEFYYGNKQNRFWKTICNYFREEVPATTEGKRDFLLRKNIALWDMVTTCEIEGSSDASVKNAKTADLSVVLAVAPIEKILLNGSLAFSLFEKKYKDLSIAYEKMPSTSPANPRFDERIWRNALDDVFRIY